MLKKLERYEKRRLKLEKLIYDFCKGNNAELARRLGKEPSYINRLLYPEGKKQKKNIGDEFMNEVIDEFNFPEDWWINDSIEEKETNDKLLQETIGRTRGTLTCAESERIKEFLSLPTQQQIDALENEKSKNLKSSEKNSSK